MAEDIETIELLSSDSDEPPELAEADTGSPAAVDISVEEPDEMVLDSSEDDDDDDDEEEGSDEEGSDEEEDSDMDDYEMPGQETEGEILKRADGLKAAGNEHFRAQRYAESCKLYSESIQVIRGASLASAGSDVLVSCLLNRAAANLQLSQPADANRDCDDVLKQDANNVKALFRKGQALSAMVPEGEDSPLLKQAKDTLRRAAGLEPKNVPVRKAYREVLARIQGSPSKAADADEKEAKARMAKAEEDKKRRLDEARREGERRAAEQRRAQERRVREAAQRRAKEAAERDARQAEAARLAQAERARDAVRHKHLSQSCLNELRKDRPASPPIPAEKREQGRVRVRFYNNTPDDVDLYFMKQEGSSKKMFDIQSGNRAGSFAMVGSKFHAESAAGKKYGPWVRASPPPATLIPSVPQDEI